MSLNKKKILGIGITVTAKETILEDIKKYLSYPRQKPLIITTPNPEQLVLAKGDRRFAEILNQSDIALPDGIGVAWAVNTKRIPGIEFLEDLVGLAAKRGYTIGLIGGYGGLAVRALECLSRRTPGLRGWGEDAPLVQLDQSVQVDQFVLEIAQKIKKTHTRMVFVGLGAPKQEYFIESLRHLISGIRHPVVLMSVGGSFDILSGSIQRAPLLVRKVGLEWLWRLMRQPWRLRRQLALLKFIWLVFREKLASQGAPLRS